MTAVAVGLAAILLCACGSPPASDGRVGVDAGEANDAGPADADLGVQLPAPAPPLLEDWDCPVGWDAPEVAADRPWAHRVCVPAPRQRCAVGTLQGPGDAACRRIGTPCPDAPERFPSEDTVRELARGFDGPIVYVDPEAAAGGDGARQTPARRLTEGLRRAGERSVLVLAPGRYPGPLVLDRTLAVVGSCVEATRVEGRDVGDVALGVVGEAAAVVANLTLSSAHWDAVGIRSTAPVDIHDVVVDGAEGVGIGFQHRAAGGRIADCLVRGARVPEGAPGGVGLLVQSPSKLEVAGCLFEDHESSAVLLIRPAGLDAMRVTLRDSVVRRARPGISVFGGVAATLTRLLVEGHVQAGILVEDLESDDRPPTVVHDLWVGRPERALDVGWSAGLVALDGATLRASQIVLDGNVGAGFAALTHDPGRGVRAALTRAFVARGEPAGAGEDLRGRYGRGALAYGDVELEVNDALLEDNRDVALHAMRWNGTTSARVALTDVVVDGVESTLDGVRGRGIDVGEGAAAELRRVAVAGARDVGLLVVGWAGEPESHAVARDVEISGTASAACADIPEGEPGSCRQGYSDTAGGSGVVVAADGDLSLDGFLLHGSTRAGLVVADGADVEAQRGVVRGNGIGVSVQGAAFEPARMTTEVFVFGNEIDLSTEVVVLPDAAEAVGPW